MKYDILYNIKEYLALRTHQGATPPGHEGPGCACPPGRAPCLMGPTWPPSTYSSTHTLRLPPEKITIQLKLVFLLPKPWILISLLEAPFPKLFREFVAWYVNPPCVQLVFVLVVYI